MNNDALAEDVEWVVKNWHQVLKESKRQGGKGE